MLEKLTLAEMAARIRSGDISSTELIQAHLRRIEEVNPQVNAMVEVCAEKALAESVTPHPGPLSGVPVTIKDQFDVAGMPTLCGSQLRLGHRAATDATAVARLKAAGAIILAKTNVPEFVASYETDNFITGLTSNPHDAERTPGGSSGGEAAAIASFCSPGGLGSDGGGSIRVPAHFCGIVGFKPTHRRVSGYGMWPSTNGPTSLMGTPGPMARTVADVRLLFQAISGPDPMDSLSVGNGGTVRSKPRIGVMRQFYKVPVDPSIAAAVEKAASKLRQAGYEVEEFTLQGLERAPNLWAFFFGDLASIGMREVIAGHEDEIHWTLKENLIEAPAPDARAILTGYAERERLRQITIEQMQRYPIVLTPAASIPAFRHRERRWQVGDKSIGIFAAFMIVTIWNLLGFPALTVPVQASETKLPTGVQIVGLPFEDETVLAVGEELEL